MRESEKVLVTGGMGYLATNLVRLLSRSECRVVRLSRSGAAFPRIEGEGQVEDLVGDIRQPAVWEAALEGVGAVFHLAAQTSAHAADSDPCADLESNVRPMLHLLEKCRTLGRNVAILFAGTVTEAGIPKRLPLDEGHPDEPITIYDLHKLIAENYLKSYVRRGTVKGAILRLANVYGPGPRSSSEERGVLNQMIRKALRGEPLTIYGKGEFLRDYVYVEDVCRAFLAARESIDRLSGEHFAIGSGEGHTIVEAVHLVCDRVAAKTGRRANITHAEPPRPRSPIEARHCVADSSRFSRATGWSASVALAEGIDRTIEAFLAGEGPTS